MPNHCRLGSVTATAFHFAACPKQHSVSPKKTPPLLPIHAAQALCLLTATLCSSGRAVNDHPVSTTGWLAFSATG
jgi:hypothetical protein